MSLVKLSNVVKRANTKEDRFNTNLIYYVGGEHIESNNALITERGLIKGSTIGPMFYFGFKKDDVLLVSRNPHLRKAGRVTFDGICSEKTFVLETIEQSILSQNYLPFIFQSDHFWDYAEAHKSGSVNFFLNWSSLANYEFNLPTIEEQKKLSDTLWQIVTTMESYKKLLAKTNEMVKAKFVEMFGTIDNSLFNSTKWKTVLQVKNGKDTKERYDDGVYPIYGSGGIMGRTNDYLCTENSVIIGRKGTIDKPLLIKEKYWNVDTAFGLIPNDKLNYIYLYWFCLQFDFIRISKSAVLPSLTKTDLENIDIPLPPIELQNQFAEFVDRSEESKSAIQASLDSLTKVYKKIITENLG